MNKLSLLICCAVALATSLSCKKEMVQDNASTATASTAAGTFQIMSPPTGWFGLTRLADGTFSNGVVIFSQVIYQTGSFVEGEPVDQVDIGQLPPGASEVDAEGPAFAYAETTLESGYAIYFHEDFNKYRQAWQKALVSEGPTPLLDDYIKHSYGTGGTVPIKKGIIVRTSTVLSGVAQAPSNYRPALKNHYGETVIILGELVKSGYIIHFKGYASDGYVTGADVFNASTQAQMTISSFSITGSRYPVEVGGYHVSGDIYLSTGIHLIINDDVNGF